MENSQKTLFDVFHIVQFLKSPYSNQETELNNSDHIAVVFSYPKKKDDKLKDKIKHFCFPDEKVINNNQQIETEYFTFALTKGDGQKFFGSCLRIFKRNEYPECFLFVTDYPMFSIWEKLLWMLKSKRVAGIHYFKSFLEELRKQPVPNLGENLSFNLHSQGKLIKESIEIKRSDELHAEYDLQKLFSTLDAKLIICLFASIIFERRILFSSSSLETLSKIILASTALLYPFNWQHIFSPILPESMLIVACSPLPFIVGIHNSLIPELEKLSLEEIVYVNLDAHTIEFDPADIALLPSHRANNLLNDIKKSQEQFKKTGIFDSKEIVNSFLNFFYKIFGDYKDYMVYDKETKKNTFDFESFANSKRKSTKKFLQAFQMTQMFEVWTNEREDSMNANQNTESNYFEKIISLRRQLDNYKQSDSSSENLFIHQEKTKEKFRKLENEDNSGIFEIQDQKSMPIPITRANKIENQQNQQKDEEDDKNSNQLIRNLGEVLATPPSNKWTITASLTKHDSGGFPIHKQESPLRTNARNMVIKQYIEITTQRKNNSEENIEPKNRKNKHSRAKHSKKNSHKEHRIHKTSGKSKNISRLNETNINLISNLNLNSKKNEEIEKEIESPFEKEIDSPFEKQKQQKQQKQKNNQELQNIIPYYKHKSKSKNRIQQEKFSIHQKSHKKHSKKKRNSDKTKSNSNSNSLSQPPTPRDQITKNQKLNLFRNAPKQNPLISQQNQQETTNQRAIPIKKPSHYEDMIFGPSLSPSSPVILEDISLEKFQNQRFQNSKFYNNDLSKNN
ncbi:receptor mediated endocytosis [Anaeramoeba ignava]|uniref:Receptor mediated endocytosis n=1 Tax=Anaeramoeba ignava TaxID=1746090 RepID=A0A9Q0L711_ANAIG|nr:receptor mediated endocytosis [Anaeramoeba ignava]